MKTKLSSQDVDDLAASWAAKLDAGPLNADAQAQLDAWLADDLRHLGGFAKARAVLARADRAKALGPNFEPKMFLEPELEHGVGGGLSRRRLMLGSGIAASVLLTGSIAEFAKWIFNTRSYSTQIGETRVVALTDGSVVTLNTKSQIEVRYNNERRGIRLIQGEALFDVAKDKLRPFVVEAQGTTVRAVGTSFTVSILPQQPVKVMVREGIVELKRPQIPVAPAVRLPANNTATAPDDEPIRTAAIDPSEVNRAISWRIGRLSFEGQTLADAAATFQRYSDIRIEIDDPTIANQTVTGLFVSNDPVGFSKAVAVALGLRAEINDTSVRLIR